MYATNGPAPNTAGYAIRDTPATPGTLPGVMARVEALLSKAQNLCGHTQQARISLCGAYPESGEKPGAPKAVPNGFIEQINEILGSIEINLALADEHLEIVCSKIG